MMTAWAEMVPDRTERSQLSPPPPPLGPDRADRASLPFNHLNTSFPGFGPLSPSARSENDDATTARVEADAAVQDAARPAGPGAPDDPHLYTSNDGPFPGLAHDIGGPPSPSSRPESVTAATARVEAQQALDAAVMAARVAAGRGGAPDETHSPKLKSTSVTTEIVAGASPTGAPESDWRKQLQESGREVAAPMSPSTMPKGLATSQPSASEVSRERNLERNKQAWQAILAPDEFASAPAGAEIDRTNGGRGGRGVTRGKKKSGRQL